MKIRKTDPPRCFEVGFTEHRSILKDCAHVELGPDEQVTFTAPPKGEYDVARKNWGFYATPSLNGRLVRFGFRSVLARNRKGLYFVMLVEKGKESLFEEYIYLEKMDVICWLDDTGNLDKIADIFGKVK
ncbi:MAG TPA: hypothetical protein PLA74_09355 [Syntrophales bacterium]|nr:hypothetical protein [Syntrophales bacterium]